jgi:phospholipase/lecithinase/hemolysin
MKAMHQRLVALAATLVLAACGGGGADTTPADTGVKTVKVFGDSLADSGTFGLKFTVQGSDSLIFPERVAQSYGLGLCNFYVFTGTTFAANSKPGCTNYAIGGAVINHSNAADPRGIPLQLATAGNFSANDLLLIDGGGNDAAALVGAYLNAPKDQAASYAALLGTLLTPTQVGTALAGGAAGMANVGGTYMQALAAKFYTAIKTTALDKGAKRVIVLNMPGITNTPRFQMVLDAIAAASGGGTTGAAARAQAEALFKGWVTTFNNELATRFEGDARVAVVDFYTAFNDQVSTPAQFSLTNVKTPACPITGMGSDGLPSYTFATCTATALSASPPAGASGANWWKSYAFSDSFHPTPYGHQLLAQLISKTLAIKGWL